MRKLIFAINITIDGCCDHTKVNGGEEIHDYFAHLIRDVDVLVYGRKTYQLMVPFWPEVARNHSGQTRAMNDFAQAFDSVNQVIVFSQSLDRAEGKNTRVLRANLREEVLKLKQQRGKAMLAGGVTLPSRLMELGLVDEYQFVVHPVLAGEGRRLFEGMNLQERLKLKLVESNSFKSGCVALRYLKQ
jgi:dihydrofolate reductase